MQAKKNLSIEFWGRKYRHQIHNNYINSWTQQLEKFYFKGLPNIDVINAKYCLFHYIKITRWTHAVPQASSVWALAFLQYFFKAD